MREFFAEYWPAVFGVSAAAGCIVLAILMSLPPTAAGTAGQPPAGQPAGSAEGAGGQLNLPVDAEEFWARLRERPPELVTLDYECPCCGTLLPVPAVKQETKNVLGGVATDFMGIQLKAPETALGRPDFSVQLFNELEIACPTDGATFEYLDLSNLANGLVPKAEFNLHGWQLSADAPELAAIPQEQWTSPARHLAHYFTIVRTGFPDYEIGWRVLAGAHAANFAVWHGDEYGVPSPVFYALAALHMQRELDNPASRMNEEERASTAIMAAELYRLLGRSADALACCALAEALPLQDKQREAIDLIKQRAAEGDFTLQRNTVVEISEPPVGWYLDMMLPAINSHIQEHRPHWSSLNDPAVIARQACALLKPAAQP